MSEADLNFFDISESGFAGMDLSFSTPTDGSNLVFPSFPSSTEDSTPSDTVNDGSSFNILDDPFADDPFAFDPFADDPFADDPFDDDPFADDPFADDPFADDPFADDPFADDPFADDPFADDPFADDPFADDPFANTELFGFMSAFRFS